MIRFFRDRDPDLFTFYIVSPKNYISSYSDSAKIIVLLIIEIIQSLEFMEW